MSEKFVGRFIAFKGDDDYADADVVIEMTQARSDGTVEICFPAPIPGKPDCYVSFKLVDLVTAVLCDYGEKP